MDNFKDSLKENKTIIIIGCIIVLIAIIAAIYNGLKSDGTTEKDLSKIEQDNYIQTNYKVNEYRVINISELDLLKSYFSDFIKKQINNPEKAWDLLSDESKNKFNNNLDEYKKYIKENTTINTVNNEIEEYRKNEDGVYDIIDSEENKYTINEYSTWDFRVTLNGKK